MNRQLADPLGGSQCRRLAFVVAAWLCLTPSTGWAGAVSPHPPAVVNEGPAWTGHATTPLASGGWWTQIYPAVEKFLSTRAGMIQFGAVMALLALAIIWWRK